MAYCFLPLLGLAFLLGGASMNGRPAQTDPAVLFDFDEPDQVERFWYSQNDGVMGGLSQGSITATETGTALFSGYVSLENNGGFAMVRTRRARYALGEYTGLALRVKGDGKVYGVYLWTDSARYAFYGGVAHDQKFLAPADEWVTVYLPFEDFQPTVFGQVVRGPSLDASNIVGLSLIIEGKQTGPFTLEVDSIRAYRADEGL